MSSKETIGPAALGARATWACCCMSVLRTRRARMCIRARVCACVHVCARSRVYVCGWVGAHYACVREHKCVVMCTHVCMHEGYVVHLRLTFAYVVVATPSLRMKAHGFTAVLRCGQANRLEKRVCFVVCEGF